MDEDNTPEKSKEEKIVEFDYLETLSGKELKSEKEAIEELGIQISLKQFTKLFNGSQKVKEKVVKETVNPPDIPPFWYKEAERAIRWSFKQNSPRPLYQEIDRLKEIEPRPDLS